MERHGQAVSMIFACFHSNTESKGASLLIAFEERCRQGAEIFGSERAC
jgi:hypothetical protein